MSVRLWSTAVCLVGYSFSFAAGVLTMKPSDGKVGRTRNQSKQSIFYKSFRQGCVLEADIVFRSLSKHSGAVLPLATGHKWWNKLPQPFAMGLQVFAERCLLSFATTWFYSVTSVLPESTEVLASCIWLTFSSIICYSLPLWIGVVCEGKKLNLFSQMKVFLNPTPTTRF